MQIKLENDKQQNKTTSKSEGENHNIWENKRTMHFFKTLSPNKYAGIGLPFPKVKLEYKKVLSK